MEPTYPTGTQSTQEGRNTSIPTSNPSDKTKPTSCQQDFNDYYNVFGLNENCTQDDIERAYRRLSAEWHPEKHPQNRVKAQKVFNQINEAYATLSNVQSRHHYNQIKQRDFSVKDAYKTFEKFFDDHGLKGERERAFFQKHFPKRRLNYYQVLGVPRTASFAQIQKAYRKLAIKYHPSANPGDSEAQAKFIEVGQAYSHLCNVFRRRNYDDVRFGEIKPSQAQGIFADFFRANPQIFEDDMSLFSNLLGGGLLPTSLETPKIDASKQNSDFSQSIRTQTVRQMGPTGPVGRSITTQKSIKQGKSYEVMTDEILRPNGSRHVTETVREDGQVKVNQYEVPSGQDHTKMLPNTKRTSQKQI